MVGLEAAANAVDPVANLLLARLAIRRALAPCECAQKDPKVAVQQGEILVTNRN